MIIVSRDTRINLKNPTKIDLPCEPRMKSIHAVNPVLGDISKDNIIIRLGCILPPLRGWIKAFTYKDP